MRVDGLQPYNYSRQEWETTPRWLFDAYRKVVLNYSRDPEVSKRFIRYLATNDALIQPGVIGIMTDEKGKLFNLSGPEAKEVIEPFMPLIEAITDEALELGKVVGYDYLNTKTEEASVILQEGMKQYIKNAPPPRKASSEKWALREMRIQLRNNVAAMVFKSIREFAVIEHLHREHLMPDEQYHQLIEKISTGLDKAGLNGIAGFLKANPDAEEIIRADHRQFTPYDYKLTGNETNTADIDWQPNDREQRPPVGYGKKQFKRSDYYKWQMDELEDRQGNPPYENWDYEAARITALSRTLGPDYCMAAEKRNKVMRSFSLGKGGTSTDQERHNHAGNLGYDLSNEELQKIFEEEGRGDLKAERAEAIYNANNMLGALDARTDAYKTGKGTAEPESEIKTVKEIADPEAQKKSHGVSGSENGQKESAPAGDVEKDQNQKAAPDTHHQDMKTTNNNANDQAHSTDSDRPKDADRKKISNGIMAGSAVLGSILVADQLHRAGKKDHKEASTEAGKEKSSKALNYVMATAAAVGVGIIVCTKPDKLVKFYDDISGLLGGRGHGK